MYKLRKLEETDLTNSILITGLPGIANVARIAADFLIQKLNAKKIYEIYSNYFPAFVMIEDDSVITLPKIELYYAEHENKKFTILIGDIQPPDRQNYELCNKILELVKPSEVITIGGIATHKEDIKDPQIHLVLTKKELAERMKNLSVRIDGNESVSLIVGAAGLFLGLSKIKNINGAGLLVETESQPTHLGIKGAKKVLSLLKEYFSLNYSLDDVENDIKTYEKVMDKKDKSEDEVKEFLAKHNIDLDPRYIG